MVFKNQIYSWFPVVSSVNNYTVQFLMVSRGPCFLVIKDKMFHFDLCRFLLFVLNAYFFRGFLVVSNDKVSIVLYGI